MRRLTWVIVGVGFFIAIIGILQRGQGNTAYYGLRTIAWASNPFGPFTNYDHAAAWMVGSFCVGAGLFVEGFARGRVPMTERIAKQSLVAFALAVLIAGIVETGSRGGVNSLFASAVAVSILIAASSVRPGSRNSIVAVIVLVAVTYGHFLYKNPRWIGLERGTFDGSATYRLSMYRSGLRMLADFPAWGVGLGGFVNAFHSYQENIVVGLVDHVHSSWLEVALESGLLGLIAFGFGVLKPLTLIGRRLTKPDFSARVLAAGYFAALLAGLLQGVVEFSFQIPADAVLFVVLAGAVAVLAGVLPKSTAAVLRPPRGVLAAAFVVLGLLSLPPGFSGGVPRWGAPFLSRSDIILPMSGPQLTDLVDDQMHSLLNPVDPSSRFNYCKALRGAQRNSDTGYYPYYPGERN